MNYSFFIVPTSGYRTFHGLPNLHFNLSRTLSFNGNDPNCVGRINFQRWVYFIHREALLMSEEAPGLVTSSFVLWRHKTDARNVDSVYRQSTRCQYKQLLVLVFIFDHLDKSCSTFQLISQDVGTGTVWDTWCVCSPGGRRYKCTRCIPGPSPKLGATCLHASTSCRCTNKLRGNQKHVSVVLHVEVVVKLRGKSNTHLSGASSASGSSRWSRKPPRG